MAADSLVVDSSADSHSGYVRKITRGRTGALFGMAGDAFALAQLIRHVRYAPTLSALFDFPKPAGGIDGLLIVPDGRVYFVDSKGRLMSTNVPFASIGSGCHFAIGAMEMGATAVEAVRVARRNDRGTGGKIHRVTL